MEAKASSSWETRNMAPYIDFSHKKEAGEDGRSDRLRTFDSAERKRPTLRFCEEATYLLHALLPCLHCREFFPNPLIHLLSPGIELY